MSIVGAERTAGDNAKNKSIVEDYLMHGLIDAVWMDAGAIAVAAIEALKASGHEIPVFVGADQKDCLRKWQDEGLAAIAPTCPAFSGARLSSRRLG